MPVKFDALKHPRDKRGRFTKSRTVLASAKEKRAARDFGETFKPANAGGDGKAYATKVAEPGQQNAAKTFAADAQSINNGLRAGDENTPGVKAMDDAMRPLPDDVVLYRKVPSSAFGNVDPQSLQGMKVRDAGYSPTQLEPHPADSDVHLFIAAPAGSRAVVNGDTGEVYLDRDSEMVVTHVAKNSAGGHDMYMTLLPKRGAKDNGTPASPAEKDPTGKPGRETAPAAPPAEKRSAPAPAKPEQAKPEPKSMQKTAEPDKPQGETEFRAQLMKQKVPQLQAQLRDRGLTPGKKRKSELVDALVADEMGHDGKPAQAETPKAEPAKTPEPKTPNKPPTSADRNHAKPVADRVRDAIAAIHEDRGRDAGAADYVMLSDVRKRLPDVSKAEFDQAIREMDHQPDVHIVPEANQKTLTPENRAGAVRFGGQDNHLIARIGQAPGGPQRDEPKPATTGRPSTPPANDDRFTSAAGDAAALAAAPLGLLRRGSAKSPLTAEQRDGLNSYRGAGYLGVNGPLRAGKTGDPRVARIDSAMADSPLTSNVVTYRGVSIPRTMFGSRVDGDLTGMEWREDAYQSTSASRGLATEFAKGGAGRSGGMLMQILAPAGTGAVEMSGPAAESELLLDRGKRMRVVRDHGMVAGVRQVDVEVIADGG